VPADPPPVPPALPELVDDEAVPPASGSMFGFCPTIESSVIDVPGKVR
jgi:hypothetical protein